MSKVKATIITGDPIVVEMCRFARTFKKVCLERWPNLFCDFIPEK